MIYFGFTSALFLLRYMLADAHRLRRQLYYFVLLALFLFSAFRFQVGCDWSGYYNQYLLSARLDWSLILNSREPIWWAILSSIRNMGLPYPVANVISNAIFFIGIHVLARRQPDPLGFLVLLFPILIINMSMSAIAQGAAIGLVCIAFTAFIDRRPIHFACWVVLAVGIHSSALIFLLLCPIASGQYTRQRFLLAAVLAIPGIILLAGGESAGVASKLYIEKNREAFGAIFRIGILGLSALYFFRFLRKKWMRYFPQDYSLASIGAIGMALAILLIPISSIIGDRFGYYLIPIQAIIFARIPFLRFKYNRELHSVFPYLMLLLMFLVWTQTSWHFQQCYIPYNSWLFGLPSGSMLR